MEILKGEQIMLKAGTVITIGKFDGLHIGHMRLIDKMCEIGRRQGLSTVMLSFSPQPAKVLKGIDTQLILSTKEKLYLLDEIGLDYYIEFPFTQKFSQMPPEHFIENVLYKQLGCRALVVGEDYRFGKDGAGDVALAQSLGKELGFDVYSETFATTKDGVKISSDYIRKSIESGNVQEVLHLCGRRFFVMDRIVDHKAYIENYANVDPEGFYRALVVLDNEKLLPPAGVYVTTSFIGGTGYLGSTFIKEGSNVIMNRLRNYNGGDPSGRQITIQFVFNSHGNLEDTTL